MKKLLLVIVAAFMLPLFGCPKEEEPPPADQTDQKPAEDPKPADSQPAMPEAPDEAKDITADNVGDKAKEMEGDLDKAIEEAKKLGADEAAAEEAK